MPSWQPSCGRDRRRCSVCSRPTTRFTTRDWWSRLRSFPAWRGWRGCVPRSSTTQRQLPKAVIAVRLFAKHWQRCYARERPRLASWVPRRSWCLLGVGDAGKASPFNPNSGPSRKLQGMTCFSGDPFKLIASTCSSGPVRPAGGW